MHRTHHVIQDRRHESSLAELGGTCAPLPTTGWVSAKLSASPWEDQFEPYCCLYCLPPRNLPLRNLERQTLALAFGRSSPRNLAWILRTGSPLHTCMAAECTWSCRAKGISISRRIATDTIRLHPAIWASIRLICIGSTSTRPMSHRRRTERW